MTTQFHYCIMSVTLFSISMYLIILYNHLQFDIKRLPHLINSITTVSLFCVYFAIVLIFKGILVMKFAMLIKNSAILGLFLLTSLSLILFISFVFIWYLPKRQSLTLKDYISALLIGSLALFMPLEPIRYFYYILVIFYATISLLFITRALHFKKKSQNVGLIYIGAGAVGVTMGTILSFIFDTYYLHFFTQAIMTFVLLGCFLYFSHYFNVEVQEGDERLQQLAITDNVTGISNQNAFELDLKLLTSSAYLGMFNINHFMGYNNLLGFERGNELLRDIATTVDQLLPDSIRLYRHYSDKFILMTTSSHPDVIYDVIRTINTTFEHKSFQGISISAYYGIYHWHPHSDAHEENAASRAITALEIASSIAKNQIPQLYEYQTEDYHYYIHNTEMEIQLKHAIDQQQFELYYQPQVHHLPPHDICSFEALIRWKYNGEWISPDQFIPIAERNGWMHSLTAFVLKQTISDMDTYPIFQGKKVAINLSADQLVDTALLETIEQAVQHSNISPSSIIFEITETSLFNDVTKVSTTLQHLKKLGFEISLDDFGTGYSSIYRFAKLDIDEVKFDKVFIKDLPDKKIYTTLQKSAELFKSFNMRLVIEGIETTEQMMAIQALPIDVLQGYYFHRPMPVHELNKLPVHS